MSWPSQRECLTEKSKASVTATLTRVLVQGLPASINRAVSYLENRLPSVTYSYAVAMTSYALANEKKLNREKLFRYISEGNVNTGISC